MTQKDIEMAKEEFNARVQWRIMNALEGIEDMLFVLAYHAENYEKRGWTWLDDRGTSWKEDIKELVRGKRVDSFPYEIFKNKR